MTNCHEIHTLNKYTLSFIIKITTKEIIMTEMAIVLGTCMFMVYVAYELTLSNQREWGENTKSFF